MSVTLIIPDLHLPFHHLRSFEFIEEAIRKYKPATVVCVGDEIDFGTMDRFKNRNQVDMTPKEELEKAKEGLRILYKLCPTLHICKSNHIQRVDRTAHNNSIPSQFLKSFREVIDAPPTWVWHEQFLIEGTDDKGRDYLFCVIHGHQTKADNSARKWSLLQGISTVAGHNHTKACITYDKTNDVNVWSMSVGSLIDENAETFNYNDRYTRRPITCLGVVENNVPHIIPMN